MEQLLNWDHDVIPTSLEDLFMNFCEKSQKYTGHATRVRLDGMDCFEVEQFLDGQWRPALLLDLRSDREVFLGAREIYGRLHYLIERVSVAPLVRYIDESDSMCRVA